MSDEVYLREQKRMATAVEGLRADLSSLSAMVAEYNDTGSTLAGAMATFEHKQADLIRRTNENSDILRRILRRLEAIGE